MRRSIHHRRFATAIAVALALPMAVLGASEVPSEALGNAQREQAANDLAVLIETARAAWAYADDKQEHFDVNFTRLLEEGRVAIEKSQTKRDLLLALRDVVAGFKDGHASLSHPDLRRDIVHRRLPIRLVDTKEGVVYGTNLVVLWKGRPMEDAIEAESRHVFASTPGMRQVLALRRLETGAANEIVPVTLKQPGGRVIESTLEYSAVLGESASPVEFRWLTNGLAYIRLTTFGVDASAHPGKEPGPMDPSGHPVAAVEAAKARIAAAFSNAAPARCLILDLRGNQGGTDLIGSFVALHLVPERFTYFKLQIRYSPQLKTVPGFKDNPAEGWAPISEWGPSRPESVTPYSGFVIILEDSLCFSTTDNLLACIRDLLPTNKVKFIGRPSGGGTGAPRPLVKLPHTDATVTLTVMKVFSPKGRLIEGRGTIPDRKIELTWRDVINGRDADLEAALEEANQHLPR